MKELTQNDLFKPPKIGDIVEGEIIKKDKSVLFLNLGNFGAARVYGKEFIEAKHSLKDVKVGEKLVAKIIALDDEDDYVALSLAQAEKELAWEGLNKKRQEDEVFEIDVLKANKGGLLSKVDGIPAFLPVSHLSSEHYPVVEDSDPVKILNKLQKLIGQKLRVKILSLNKREKNLILSEKAALLVQTQSPLAKLDEKSTPGPFKIGDWVEGSIERMLDFGALVRISSAEGQSFEGLLPNSELKEADLTAGKSIRVQIQAIRNGKLWFTL